MQASINHQLSTINLLCFLALLVPAFFVPTANAGERSVTAAEATGTYRDAKSNSEIRILALRHGKLKVQLALVYEYKSGAGPMANLGDASGEATIENDTAVFVPEAPGECTKVSECKPKFDDAE